MNLTDNFSLEELCNSSTAKAKGIDNTPSPEVVNNLKLLAVNILQPLRATYGRPITVNSGYRSPALNKAVGGAGNSDHMYGRAADISVGSRAGNKILFDLIIKLKLPDDQLIFEKGSRKTGPDWVHVSFNPARNRSQILYLV